MRKVGKFGYPGSQKFCPRVFLFALSDARIKMIGAPARSIKETTQEQKKTCSSAVRTNFFS